MTSSIYVKRINPFPLNWREMRRSSFFYGKSEFIAKCENYFNKYLSSKLNRGPNLVWPSRCPWSSDNTRIIFRLAPVILRVFFQLRNLLYKKTLVVETMFTKTVQTWAKSRSNAFQILVPEHQSHIDNCIKTYFDMNYKFLVLKKTN